MRRKIQWRPLELAAKQGADGTELDVHVDKGWRSCGDT